MKEENTIEVKNITKIFKVYLDKGSTLKEKLLFSKRRKYEERKVLDGISFEVKKGEAIGLIGHNGCGKSTTLKLLTRIMYPDSGSIKMKGRVSSLIELGAGFHPDMSGRENIYINASIFGLTRKEIEERFEKIVSFSELEEFIDNPVRTYSSGMYMRLAFSVAINVDADILLIDEILAVGDANFQSKCFNKLREIKSNGTTIVIVSHSLSSVEQFCEKSIWIHEGKIKSEGKPRDVHPQYLNFMGEKRQENVEKESEKERKNEKNSELEPKDTKTELKEKIENRWGNGKAKITDIIAYNSKGEEATVFKTGEKIYFEVNYKVRNRVENANIGIGIFRSDGINCYGTNTRIDGKEKINLVDSGKFLLEFSKMELLPGEYNVDFAIEEEMCVPVDYYKNAYKIIIYSDIEDIGIARLEHRWNLG